MQEEVENRTVNLVVSTTRLSARTVMQAVSWYLNHRKQKKHEKAAQDPYTHGKQTVKQLIGQNQGVTNVDIAKTDLKGFERYARKYGVDYAIRKDRSVQPPRYLVFFKSRDSDAINNAIKEYTANAFRKSSRPSVLRKLRDLTHGITKDAGRSTRRKEQVR